jgi:hypothetical protein
MNQELFPPTRGQQYNRKATDLPSLQSAISSEVAGWLRLKLSNIEQQQLTRRLRGRIKPAPSSADDTTNA